MNRHSPASALVAGTVVAAVICTAVADGGWIVWIPVALAVGVFTAMKAKVNR